MLGRAGERGQRRRAEAAAIGHVTWENPSPILQKILAAEAEQEEKMAREKADEDEDGEDGGNEQRTRDGGTEVGDVTEEELKKLMQD